MTEISGKAAVVTGGGSGIGMGLAKELARQGAAVAIADIMLENAINVADMINAKGGKAIALACDVCDRSSVARMKDEANAALGPIHLVFANAGATAFEPLMAMSDEDVDWILDVNLRGVMHTVRAFLPNMIAAGTGHLCATASLAGLMPGWIAAHSPYSAAKAGIIGLMMNLQIELAEHGIHTTSYCPGGVATGMRVNNARYRPKQYGGAAEGEIHLGEENQEQSSLKFYHPEDVAPMVLNAVRNNRAFVFDHPDLRPLFATTYSNVVEACYDDADDWMKKHGEPAANPHGADLR